MGLQHTNTGVDLWRFIAGVGIGVELVTIDAYVCELAPAGLRGRAFAINQFVQFLAIPVLALTSWVLVPRSPLGLAGWRWVVFLGAPGAIFVWVIRRNIPESPRWLAQQGRLDEAEKAIAQIEARVVAEIGHPVPRQNSKCV